MGGSRCWVSPPEVGTPVSRLGRLRPGPRCAGDVLVSAWTLSVPGSVRGEASPGTLQTAWQRRRPRVRPGSAAPAPPSSPSAPRGRRPTGNSAPRGPARRAPGGRGRAPRLPRPAQLPAKTTHLLLLLHGSLQATDSPAGDALTPSPSPAAATEAAAPPRCGCSGLGARQAPVPPSPRPAHKREAPPPGGKLHA